MDERYFYSFSGMEAEEFMLLKQATKDMTEDQLKQFVMVYQSRRKDPQTILLVTLLGFFVVAGVQRFMTNQIGMGLLYFFTGGLCLIGTIVDLVNYKKLALDYNQKMMFEAMQLCKMMNS
ncbi:MAG: TM2 domain-containing protein [Bacteroidetes bacterium]|nr:TM2 domain-containing protein [Bacteroidota bacterium]